MSKAPKIDPSAWASQRDAKIQRANELRELRKRESQNNQNGQPNTNQPANQPPPQQSSPRNIAPPSEGWVGGAMGGAPAGGGRYNKVGRGGFTFAQQTPQPSVSSTGDENDVRQQLWEMKEAAQQQRRSVSGTGYGHGGAHTDSPSRQHVGNYGQSDWSNPQNKPPPNVASSWAGGYDQPTPVEVRIDIIVA